MEGARGRENGYFWKDVGFGGLWFLVSSTQDCFVGMVWQPQNRISCLQLCLITLTSRKGLIISSAVWHLDSAVGRAGVRGQELYLQLVQKFFQHAPFSTDVKNHPHLVFCKVALCLTETPAVLFWGPDTSGSPSSHCWYSSPLDHRFELSIQDL